MSCSRNRNGFTSRPVSIELISKYRTELMGIAMLLVVLFHGYVPQTSWFYGLKRMGNVGVDVFLFLSGIGLWFSWHSRPNLKHFYKQRFLRVYPTWLLLASCFYGFHFYHKSGFSKDVFDLLGDVIAHLDFWLHGELTFWYIPALMALYLISPFYIQLVNRNRLYTWLAIVPIVWCCAVAWIPFLHHTLWHLEIFWSRISIFLIGINMAPYILQKKTFAPNTRPLLWIMFLFPLFVACYLEQWEHGNYPLFINRMLYIPITISGVLLASEALHHTNKVIKQCWAFLGSISLELYLLHLHFILVPLQRHHLNYFVTLVLCLAISIPLAMLVQRIVSFTLKHINR